MGLHVGRAAALGGNIRRRKIYPLVRVLKNGCFLFAFCIILSYESCGSVLLNFGIWLMFHMEF